jgi:inhibitor of cysteine peptidase
MRKVFCLIFILLIVFAAAACGNTATEAEKMYGRSDRNITVSVKDTFLIQLETNPTTGYDWTASVSDETVVSPAGKEYLAEPVDTAIVGSGGVDVFTFKALEKGSAVITFVYERSFEQGSAEDTLIYNVTVE